MSSAVQMVVMVLAAALEVGGDALVRKGLRGAGVGLVALGFIVLGSYGIVVNRLALDFSRLLGLRGEAGFRLVVHPGGCSGYSSEFSIEPTAKDGDLTLSVNGMKLLVPAESGKLLADVIIDHVDTPTQAGLTFFDPKAPATCATESSSRSEMVQLTKLNA
jgi:iron-sulfur cluster assembly accessory protein